ncbi:hypothetical protein JOF57_004041 [Mycolicibacterium lutetiense]|uniref:Uncharacterized protein n=1 Tax=Mycolicibacterium lutetiense TaxID=1641992 RepID=A0ABS4ZXA4_9MYCO|nr:hypothetical protein [Mycolicibacterium lutetiense]
MDVRNAAGTTESHPRLVPHAILISSPPAGGTAQRMETPVIADGPRRARTPDDGDAALFLTIRGKLTRAKIPTEVAGPWLHIPAVVSMRTAAAPCTLVVQNVMKAEV